VSDIITARGLVKRYGEVTALDGLDLSVPEGSVYGLLGPNGAGKTTTVRILTTLLKPDAGSATVDGFDVVKKPNDVRRVIGLTGQYAAVDEYLTGRENLRMFGDLYHLPSAYVKDRSQEQYQTLIRRTIIGKAYSIGYDGSTRIFTLSYKNGTPEDAVAFLDAVVHAIGPELTDQVRPLVQEAQAAIEISLEDTMDSLARAAEQAVQDAMTDIPIARRADTADGVQLPCTESIVSYLDNNPSAIRATMEMMRSVTRLERIVQDATSMYIVLGGATAFEETTGSRSTTVIIATITAFFLTVFLAFVLEYIRRAKADPEEMAKLRAAWRRE